MYEVLKHTYKMRYRISRNSCNHEVWEFDSHQTNSKYWVKYNIEPNIRRRVKYRARISKFRFNI